MSSIIKIGVTAAPLYFYFLPTLLSALVGSGKFHLIPWDLVDTFSISYKNLHWVQAANLIPSQLVHRAGCRCPGNHLSYT